MTTEIDLLRAIAAEPDDDSLRRVYADWLIEQGNPRGELVQLELALAAMDDFDDQRKSTKARIAELYEAHAAVWMAPFRALELPVDFQFVRGIVGGVRGGARELAAAAPRILNGAPLVTSVDIVVDPRELDPLAGSPLLPRIRSLTLSNHTPVRPTGWQALVLPEVRAITLSAIAVGPDDTETLLGPPNAPKLTSLTISNCRLNRGALDVLARVQCRLTKLDMPAGKQGPRLGEMIGGNAALHGLRMLRIPGNEIGSAGFAALLPALSQVEQLDVRGCNLTAADLGRLLDDGVLPAVRELWIGGQPLDAALLERLAAWPGAANLRKLHIGSAGVGDRGALALAASPLLSNVRSLVISGSRLQPATEAALVASPQLASARIYVGNRSLARKPAAPKPKRASRKR